MIIPLPFVLAPPPAFTALSGGDTPDGWQGLVGNPITRAAMSRPRPA